MAFQRVKQFKDVEVHYDAPQGVRLIFYTDMPGSAMAERKRFDLPASTGRKTFTVPLDGIEGTLYKARWTAVRAGGINDDSGSITSKELRLFGGVLRSRAIGVYLDTANGEYWETQESGIGI